MIDLAAALDRLVPGTSDPDRFVRLIADRDDSRLEVNPDGRGGSFEPLATLDGLAGTSAEA